MKLRHDQPWLERHCHTLNARSPIAKDDFESVGGLANVCVHIVFNCLPLAPIGRPDISWTASASVEVSENGTVRLAKMEARLVSNPKCMSRHRQWCHVGDEASECKPGFSKTPMLLDI